jgi:hypothetical protein
MRSDMVRAELCGANPMMLTTETFNAFLAWLGIIGMVLVLVLIATFSGRPGDAK